MDVTLNWNPAGGSNSTGQLIQYRIPSQTSNWTNFNVVGPVISTAQITGLLDNYIYDFRVVTNCTVGGPSPSIVQSKIKFVCPVVSTSISYDEIGYGFLAVGADVTSYTVNLLNSSNSIVASKSHSVGAGSVNDIFTGLTPSTSYKIRVIMNAGAYNSTCSDVLVTTTSAPACDAPTNLNVSIS